MSILKQFHVRRVLPALPRREVSAPTFTVLIAFGVLFVFFASVLIALMIGGQ